jgi:hypothetical protein
LVGLTSTDFLTAEEAGMGETAEDEMVDDVRTDGFGAPPPGNVTEMGSARNNAETNTVVGPPPSLQRGRSAGGFVYPQNQVSRIVSLISRCEASPCQSADPLVVW